MIGFNGNGGNNQASNQIGGNFNGGFRGQGNQGPNNGNGNGFNGNNFGGQNQGGNNYQAQGPNVQPNPIGNSGGMATNMNLPQDGGATGFPPRSDEQGILIYNQKITILWETDVSLLNMNLKAPLYYAGRGMSQNMGNMQPCNLLKNTGELIWFLTT